MRKHNDSNIEQRQVDNVFLRINPVVSSPMDGCFISPGCKINRAFLFIDSEIGPSEAVIRILHRLPFVENNIHERTDKQKQKRTNLKFRINLAAPNVGIMLIPEFWNLRMSM